MSEIAERLARAIPNPEPELRHEDAWQLLVATILSARSTDETVNEVTRTLFDRWPSPEALAEADLEAVEEVVHPTGFFRQKAERIVKASQVLVEDFDGQVPRTMDELTTLPGVARKTANVVLGSAFGVQEGVVVDSHVQRVANRLGLTEHDKPPKIEQDLCERFERDTWADVGHRLVLHGRYVCTARNPSCARCPLNEPCPSAEAEPEEDLEHRLSWEQGLVGQAVAAKLGRT